MATTKDYFFDREREIKKLEEKYKNLDNGSELIFLYGRRRLGKTRLISEFLNKHKKESIYTFIVDGGSKKQILKQISRDISNSGDFFESEEWDSLFRYINLKSKNQKFIFVIDEFQRLHKKHGYVISRFQKEWDFPLKNNNLMLILVGSSIGMMRRVALEDSSPLLGRPTWTFQLKPFTYMDFREMFKGFTEEERIKIFSIFGGTPDYLSRLKKSIYKISNLDLLNIIRKLVLKEDGELFEQPENLLKSELRASDKYLEILLAISRGSGKISKDELESKIKSKDKKITYNSLGYYLTTLEKFLDLVKIEQPLFFKGKMGKYEISDNSFKFYFSFIYPYKDAIKLNNLDYVLSNINKNLDVYVGRCYEEIIKDILIRFNKKDFGGLRLNFFHMGSWWNRTGEEIDICAVGKDEVLLGEIKWNEKPITKSLPEDLIRKSKLVNTNKMKKLLIFSKKGFNEECIRFMKEKDISYFDLTKITNIIDGRIIGSWTNVLNPDKSP